MLDCKTYSLKEVSTILGIGYSTIYSLVRKGSIPSIKIGGQYFIPVDVFNDWFSSLVKGGDSV